MSTEQTTAVVKTTARDVRVVHDDSEISYLLDTGRFEHMYRIAGSMARASLIPAHLKGATFEETQANCFLVVNQAMRWKFDPFAIAPETYAIGGKLGFQGKLVAAAINARGNLAERLTYTFNDKTGDALEVTVSGRLEGEDKPRTVTVTVGQARTQNQMWTKDPQQKLIYTGAIKWARRHKPEVILGVLTDDDAEAIRDEARFIAAAKVKTPEFEAGPGPIELEPGQPTPRAHKKRERHPPAHDTAQQTPTPEVLPAEQVAANEAAEKSPAPAAPADELSFEQVVDGVEPGESDEIKQLREAMKVADVTEQQVVNFMGRNNYLNEPKNSLSCIRADKVASLTKALNAKQANIIASIKS